MISAVLVGFALCQSLIYFMQYAKDKAYIKILVAVTLICEVVHQGIISFTLYWYTITNFGQFSVFDRFIWSLCVPCIPNAFAIVLSQSFFIMRIWYIGKKTRLLVYPLFAMVFVEFTLAMYMVGKALRCNSFAEYAAFKNMAIGRISLTAGIDVTIAITLVMSLHHSKTGYRRTDGMLNTLILYAMSTGAVTAVWALATVAAIVTTGISFTVLFFYYILGRLYFNSILTSLNVRHSIQAASASDGTVSFGTKSKERASTVRVMIDTSITTSGETDKTAF